MKAEEPADDTAPIFDDAAEAKAEAFASNAPEGLTEDKPAGPTMIDAAAVAPAAVAEAAHIADTGGKEDEAQAAETEDETERATPEEPEAEPALDETEVRDTSPKTRQRTMRLYQSKALRKTT
nr:hypothetical protein [Marinicella sp. W31]MDC2875735.1 hypothetical protein [Marinicella sp. W31]